MVTVGQLLKMISVMNPQLSPARLTFFNYLSHFHSPDDILTDDILNGFFEYVLDYAHWQQNKNSLGQEIHNLLKNYCHQYQVSMELSHVHWPQQTQIVDVESTQDLTDALQLYLKSQCRKGERYKLVVDQNKKILGIILNNDGSLIVKQFDKRMTIRNGFLEPLRQNLNLYYNSDLELDFTKVHRWEVSPFITAQFQIQSKKVTGALMRGYICQRFFELRASELSAYPKLFYSVKRAEQFFVNRQTDEFYQEITSALERAIQLVKLDDPDGAQVAMDSLVKAQNAIDYVFTGDKLLGLLIRDLQHTMAQRNTHWKRAEKPAGAEMDKEWNEAPVNHTAPPQKNMQKTTEEAPNHRPSQPLSDLTN